MKRTHMLRGVTGWFTPGLIFAAISGCGGGTDSAPADTSRAAPAQSSVTGDAAAEKATLLDVLHLTNKATIGYKGGVSGNTMGNTYWIDTLAWDGLSFSGIQDSVLDKGTNMEEAYRIKVQGRIADDFASLKELHVETDSVAKATGVGTKDRFTFRDIPVNEIYSTPRKDWRTHPSVDYKMTCKSGEIANHLEGWQAERKDSKNVVTTSNQKELLTVYVPGAKGTFEIDVFFSKESP